MSDDLAPAYDEFLVIGPVFLISPFPRPQGIGLPKSLVRGEAKDKDGVVGMYVVAFTDLPAAEAFIETLGENGKNQKPLTFANKQDFADAIAGLLNLGDTHIGFDPGGRNVRRIPIERVLEGIRNRPR